MSSDVVVVANRLPVEEQRGGTWVSSPGGLVRALLPVLRRTSGAWVGWTGSNGEPEDLPAEHEGVSLVAVPLSEEERLGYYQSLANEALWPLYHDAIRHPVIDHDAWEIFVTVNRRFARATAKTAARGGIAWVHDYHLQLVPDLLRRLRPDLGIGFFLHIPFPPPELLSRLPWREDLLRGMLGADVIGFQHPLAAENFLRSCSTLLGLTVGTDRVRIDKRTVRVEAHPISIDVAEVEALANDPASEGDAHAIRERLGCPRTVFLGVDRLDYTKGIDRRLAAFDHLLSEARLDPREAVLVQVAVPTRAGLAAYDEERARVEQLVGAVNGRHARLGQPVVHYLHRSLPLHELVALYRAADVCLVTPLKDGMNLVAKEYVASRVDGNGVLVLSEFAGAAGELTDAILVNPHDDRRLAQAFVEAAELPMDEARRRMAGLRSTVAAKDVHRWADGFLTVLGAAAGADAADAA
jgi:trehalose 6-phosphate synthase